MNSLSATTTDATVRAAKQRCPQAWERIYLDLSPRLLEYLRRMTYSDAEDIVSEVFVNMVRSIDAFEGDADDLRAWAYAIARNARADAVRSGKRNQQKVDAVCNHIPSTAATEDQRETIVSDDRVTRLLAKLTPRQREVMMLRIVADLTIDQVARIMNEQPPTIKALQRRAVAHLQKLLAANTM